MIESIDTSLIDWSRAQFAMTAMYHWIFVPLTLGLAVDQVPEARRVLRRRSRRETANITFFRGRSCEN